MAHLNDRTCLPAYEDSFQLQFTFLFVSICLSGYIICIRAQFWKALSANVARL